MKLKRNLYGHKLAALPWQKFAGWKILQIGFEKLVDWECLYVHREKKLFLSVYVDDPNGWTKGSMAPMWAELRKHLNSTYPAKLSTTSIWVPLKGR